MIEVSRLRRVAGRRTRRLGVQRTRDRRRRRNSARRRRACPCRARAAADSLPVGVARPAEARLEARCCVARAPLRSSIGEQRHIAQRRVEIGAAGDVAPRDAAPSRLAACGAAPSSPAASGKTRETEACGDRPRRRAAARRRGARPVTSGQRSSDAQHEVARERDARAGSSRARVGRHEVEIREPGGDAVRSGLRARRADRAGGTASRRSRARACHRAGGGGRSAGGGHVEPLLAGSGIDRAVVVRAECDLVGAVFGTRV